MTFWIIPEFDRQEWAVCLFWLQAANTMRLPQIETKTSNPEPFGDQRDSSPLFKEEVGTSGPTKLTAKRAQKE